MAIQKYVKIENNVIVKTAMKDNPTSAEDAQNNLLWRPVTIVAPPAYDGSTHHPPVKTQGSSVGDSAPGGRDALVEAWASPVAKTAQELDDEAVTQANRIGNDNQMKIVKSMMSEGFELRNEYLVSQALPPLTLTQYANKLKAYKDTPVVSDAAFKAFIKDLIS